MNPPANAGDIRDVGLIPGSGRSPGGGHGNPLQYSCLGNPIHRGAWWAAVHGVTESDRTEAASPAWSLVADVGPALCAQYLIHPQKQSCRVVAPPCHRSGHRGSQTVSHLPGFYVQSHQDWHLNLNHSLPVLEHSTCGRIRKGAEQLGGGPGIARTGHHDIESGSIYRLVGTVRAGKRGGAKKALLLGLLCDRPPFSRPHSPSIRPCSALPSPGYPLAQHLGVRSWGFSQHTQGPRSNGWELMPLGAAQPISAWNRRTQVLASSILGVE